MASEIDNSLSPQEQLYNQLLPEVQSSIEDGIFELEEFERIEDAAYDSGLEGITRHDVQTVLEDIKRYVEESGVQISEKLGIVALFKESFTEIKNKAFPKSKTSVPRETAYDTIRDRILCAAANGGLADEKIFNNVLSEINVLIEMDDSEIRDLRDLAFEKREALKDNPLINQMQGPTVLSDLEQLKDAPKTEATKKRVQELVDHVVKNADPRENGFETSTALKAAQVVAVELEDEDLQEQVATALQKVELIVRVDETDPENPILVVVNDQDKSPLMAGDEKVELVEGSPLLASSDPEPTTTSLASDSVASTVSEEIVTASLLNTSSNPNELQNSSDSETVVPTASSLLINSQPVAAAPALRFVHQGESTLLVFEASASNASLSSERQAALCVFDPQAATLIADVSSVGTNSPVTALTSIPAVSLAVAQYLEGVIADVGPESSAGRTAQNILDTMGVSPKQESEQDSEKKAHLALLQEEQISAEARAKALKEDPTFKISSKDTAVSHVTVEGSVDPRINAELGALASGIVMNQRNHEVGGARIALGRQVGEKIVLATSDSGPGDGKKQDSSGQEENWYLPEADESDTPTV